MTLDKDWAIGELRAFLHVTEKVPYRNDPGSVVVALGTHQRGSEPEAAMSAHVVEQILDRVLPSWREETEGKTGWGVHRRWASRAIAALEREQELEEKLGDASPRLHVGGLHSWVWDPAKKLWNDGHRRAALHAAAASVNTQTQAKTGRVDLSDKALFEQVLSLEAPAPGKPRLRVAVEDGTPHYRSQQEGCMKLAVGLSQTVRNEAAHTVDELPELIALERLAALSMLARLLDEADLLD